MMDHDFVIENKTAERYLLGELTDAERDAYEEHYFECPECAEELRCGAEFMHYAREVVQQEAAEQAVAFAGSTHMDPTARNNRPFWMRAVPVGALAAVLLTACFFTFQIATQIATRSYDRHQLEASSAAGLDVAIMATKARAAQEPVQFGPHDRAQVRTTVPEEVLESHAFTHLQAVILDDSNAEKLRYDIPDDKTHSFLYLPPVRLESGSYAVAFFAVDGNSRTEIKGEGTRRPFSILRLNK
ncbi:MAG: zf-HC2 domain-containing protein [Acidobacteriia bacterium]|nr:zf-HC2 domain-containing protein [Terriglobia bacterium]